MTCRIHSFFARFAALVACACPLGVMAEGGTSALAATGASRPPSSAVVATVNDEIITQADLDNAVAVSGAHDTTVLRRTLRHRLIAMELLRQAAEKPRHVRSYPAVPARYGASLGSDRGRCPGSLCTGHQKPVGEHAKIDGLRRDR